MLSRGEAVPSEITLIDGDSVKTRAIAEDGQETIDTTLGPLDTLKFSLVESDPKRSFVFWLAPALNYQLVKLEKRDKRRLLALTLTSYTPAGTP